jgi:aminobenzoyl-glutamate utilization protein B
LFASNGLAAPRQTALDWISRNESFLARAADDLFELAEPAHHELRTFSYLEAELRRAGFEIESGVAGLPTAFVASFGSGSPSWVSSRFSTPFLERRAPGTGAATTSSGPPISGR